MYTYTLSKLVRLCTSPAPRRTTLLSLNFKPMATAVSSLARLKMQQIFDFAGVVSLHVHVSVSCYKHCVDRTVSCRLLDQAIGGTWQTS